MSVILTRHRSLPQDGGVYVQILGRQIGDRVTVTNAAAFVCAAKGLYKLSFTADHDYRIGAAGDNVALGEKGLSGQSEVRWLEVGNVLKVS